MTHKVRGPRLGILLTGIYLGIVLVLFILTAISTKPSDVGLGWIPFVMLAMPWWRLFPGNSILDAIPGFVLNAASLYFCGVLVEMVWRNVRHGQRSIE